MLKNFSGNHSHMPKLTVLDIRRMRVRELIHREGGPGNLAKKLGYNSGSYISQIAGRHPIRPISESVARFIERRLALPPGWLDHESCDANALVAEVARQVMEATARLGHSTDASKVAEVVSLVYEQAVTTGTVDRDYIHRLLKLTE